MIPSALKGIVTGIFGLDQRRVARRKSGLRRTSPQAGALSPLSPSDLEQRYNFPAGDAAGETIAIAEFGGGYFADDMVAYCKKFQLPVPNVQATPLSAPAYTFQEILALPPMQSKEELGNAVEVMLDVQVIAGLCPKANLIVYFASFDERGWVDLLSTAITQRPVALSISWGLAEEDPNWSAGAIAAINERLNAIRLLGVMHSRRARQGPATPSRFACAWSASCPFVGTDRFRSRCRTIESASDAATALSAVMAAVASGEVTPREAAEIASLVEIFVHTLEAHEFEHRLLALGEPMSTEEE